MLTLQPGRIEALNCNHRDAYSERAGRIHARKNCVGPGAGPVLHLPGGLQPPVRGALRLRPLPRHPERAAGGALPGGAASDPDRGLC